MGDEFVALGRSLLAAAEDVLEAVLQKVDAAALCRLKAASVAWCAHVRRELCNRLWVRLCRREGQPEPAGVDSITDLDVECLNEAGRPWEVVVAGRQLPQLARLHGYGFVVDVQAVREADLGAEDEEEEDDEEEDDDNGDSPLGGESLRSCIQGEGDPPNELLLAAVACAASGTVRGVPVQRLREDDAIGTLSFHDSGIGVTGATLLGLMLPAATSVRSLKYATNPNPNPYPSPNPLSAPLAMTQHPPLLPHARSMNNNSLGPEREALLSPRASRATRRCNFCSRPLGARTRPRMFAFLSAPIDTPRSRVAEWPTPSSAASMLLKAAAPTPPRASPSCARGSRRAT